MSRLLMSFLMTTRQWLKALVLFSWLGLSQGQALAQVTVTYFHNDISGTPLAATDSAGNLVWKETYRPYGERLTNSPASSGNGVWFTSKPQDARTGLVYMGARYYDPVIGRFMGTDPVGFVEGNVHSVNRYAYANNNPYRYVDPDGNHPVLVLAAIGLFLLDFHLSATSNEPFVGIGSGVAQAGSRLAGKAVASAAKGIPADAQFAQKTYGATFSKDGIFAGKSVDDVAAALRSGGMKPSEIPIDYIVRDGKTIILNTRSSQALDAAGIARSEWSGVNRSGIAEFEKRLTDQLSRNPGGPFDTVRRSGGK